MAINVIEQNENVKFDVLIIDEAQDILSSLRSEYNVLFLDKLLKGGFKNGKMGNSLTDETQNIFGDFGKQYDPYKICLKKYLKLNSPKSH